jgi:hypothetical protein
MPRAGADISAARFPAPVLQHANCMECHVLHLLLQQEAFHAVRYAARTTPWLVLRLIGCHLATSVKMMCGSYILNVQMFAERHFA